MEKEIEIFNQRFEIYTISGKITGLSQQTFQSGGGGRIIDGYGFIAPIITNTSCNFFLKTEKKENPVHLTNVYIPMRNGHNVTLIWGRRVKDTETFYLLGLINHDTKLRYELVTDHGLTQMNLVSQKVKIGCIGGVVLFIFLPIISWIFLIFNAIRNARIDTKMRKITRLISLELENIAEVYRNEFIEKCRVVELT
jgi:hypothetical protein